MCVYVCVCVCECARVCVCVRAYASNLCDIKYINYNCKCRIGYCVFDIYHDCKCNFFRVFAHANILYYICSYLCKIEWCNVLLIRFAYISCIHFVLIKSIPFIGVSLLVTFIIRLCTS